MLLAEQAYTYGTFTHARSRRRQRRVENWLQHKSLHAFTQTQSWSGSKIRSAINGFNTQFSASPSKLRTPNHLCPQQMPDPPHPLCIYVNITVVAEQECQNRPITALPMCEHTFTEKMRRQLTLSPLWTNLLRKGTFTQDATYSSTDVWQWYKSSIYTKKLCVILF